MTSRQLSHAAATVWMALSLAAAGCQSSRSGETRDASPSGSNSNSASSEKRAHPEFPSASTKPSVEVGGKDNAADWSTISSILGRLGTLSDDVFRIVVPRDDLDVSIDSMPVPTAAGIESSFRFYRCPCGRMNVIGEFVVTDYEANDVMDVLRQHQFIVSSMAPLLLYDRPHLLGIRFQAEGKSPELAKTLREAISWTGKERMSATSQPAGAPK